jgi:hypothetical protein
MATGPYRQSYKFTPHSYFFSIHINIVSLCLMVETMKGVFWDVKAV